MSTISSFSRSISNPSLALERLDAEPDTDLYPSEPVSRESTPESIHYRTASEEPEPDPPSPVPPEADDDDEGEDLQQLFHTPDGSNAGDNAVRRHFGDIEDTKTTVLNFSRILAGADWDSHQKLGMHLLNAHILKKRHPHGDSNKLMKAGQRKKKGRRFVAMEEEGEEEEEEEESGSDDEADHIPVEERRFITNQWTAWPLGAGRVPRAKEHVPGRAIGSMGQRRRSNDDATKEEMEQESRPSQMLEEVLTALIIRKATGRIRQEGRAGLKPAIDDDESVRLLKPIVRNVISRLDSLLVGLHQEREHYVKGLIPSAEGGDAKRKWDQFKADVRAGVDDVDPLTLLDTTPALGDSDDWQGQKGHKKKRKREITNPEDYAKYLRNRWYRVKPRNWSQVMGMAAIKGWDDQALEKAAARCTALFDQNMEFRTLGRKSTKGTVWSAKDGRPRNAAQFREPEFLEEIKVSWGGQKRKIEERKQRNQQKRAERAKHRVEDREGEVTSEEGEEDQNKKEGNENDDEEEVEEEEVGDDEEDGEEDEEEDSEEEGDGEEDSEEEGDGEEDREEDGEEE